MKPRFQPLRQYFEGQRLRWQLVYWHNGAKCYAGGATMANAWRNMIDQIACANVYSIREAAER